jgi:hypothetical protein
VVALLLPGAPARGQRAPGDVPLGLDLGLARIQQAGTAPLVAPSLGASWREQWRRASLGVSGVAAAGEGRVAAQLAGDAARTFGAGALPREVTAEVRGVRVPNTPWAAQLLVGARQHLRWGGGGVWAGARGGIARQVGEAWPSVAAEAGAWWRAGAAGRLALTVDATRARVAERGLVAAGVNAFGPVEVRTADLVASYARAVGRVELNAWAGGRAYGPRGLRALPPDDVPPDRPGALLGRRLLAAGSATLWAAPTVGLTASAGVLPNDPVRGVPAARHVVLAVRVRPGAPRPTLRPAPAPAAPAGPALTLEPHADEESAPDPAGVPAVAPARRVVRVTAPGARRVELRADATGWRAVALTLEAGGGAWRAELPLAPGTHRVLVRVDDGPWRPPANLATVDDDLGGRVGLLVAP